MELNGEFAAVYLTLDGQKIKFPLVKDGAGSYRLNCENGPQPIRWIIGDLEFSHFEMVDPSRSSQFMNLILATPARKTRQR